MPASTLRSLSAHPTRQAIADAIRRSRPVGAVLALALIAPGIALSAPRGEQPEPKTHLEAIDRTLNHSRDFIANAVAKVRQGVVGGLTRSTGGENTTGTLPKRPEESGPAIACCGFNIDRVREDVITLREQFAAFEQCHIAAEAGREARDLLVVAREDVEGLGEAIDAFARSSNAEELNGSLGALQRAFILLEKTRKNIPDCDLAAPDDEGGKKRKRKKRG